MRTTVVRMILFVSFVSVLFLIWESVIIVRPAMIHVYDYSKNQSLKNVVVYYGIQIYGNDYMKLGTYDRMKVEEKYFTDSKGEVFIKRRFMVVYPWEELRYEIVCVNLDVVEASKEMGDGASAFFNCLNIHDLSNTDLIVNPLGDVRGSVACSSTSNFDEKLQGGSVRRKFDVIWNNGSFLKDKEEFSFGLRASGR